MASGKTANYGLSQWEATDQVVMKDFNDDNEKIDAGIKAAQVLAEDANALAEKTAGAAWTNENSPFVIGTYTGNATASGMSQHIELGFKPKVVWAQRLYLGPMGADYALAIQGSSLVVSDTTIFGLTDTGFTAGFVRYSSNYSGCPNMNANNSPYIYVALR